MDRRAGEHKPEGFAPLVSVIAVVFRDRVELQKIVESVAPFRSERLELIVIDGGSKDGTLEFLQSNGEEIDFWMSEPDRGIYDAMNKGIQAARGEYVLHLNAGDRLRAVPWEALRECGQEGVDVVACPVLMDGHEVFIPRTDFTSKIDNTWHHQGTFYRRATHLGYDRAFRICGDFEHNQRLLKRKCSIRHLPDVVADHANNGMSMQKSARREIYRSIRKNFGVFFLIPAALRFWLAPLWLRYKHRNRDSAVAH
jgi:glycosyltransferase involved in cell wall biosynthesis